MQRNRLRVITVRYLPTEDLKPVRILNSKSAADVFSAFLNDSDREKVAVLHLNARNQVISTEVVSVGTLTGSLVHPREVFKGALLQNAAAIIVAHNHPSGDVNPSSEDKKVAKRLASAAEIVGISMLDFLIVAPGGAHWSGADAGELI